MENLNDFNHYVSIVLNNWSALKMAIDNNFSNCTPRETEENVLSLINLISERLRSGTETFDFVDELEDILYTRFHTLLEDDSGPEVVQALTEMRTIFLAGHSSDMEAFLGRLQSTVPIHQAVAVPRAPQRVTQAEPVIHDNVNSDGWTQVTSSRRPKELKPFSSQ